MPILPRSKHEKIEFIEQLGLESVNGLIVRHPDIPDVTFDLSATASNNTDVINMIIKQTYRQAFDHGQKDIKQKLNDLLYIEPEL